MPKPLNSAPKFPGFHAAIHGLSVSMSTLQIVLFQSLMICICIAMSSTPYNNNVFLAAVIALLAAIILVALLHLYGRCLLQRHGPVSAADIANNPHALHHQQNSYEFEISVCECQEGLDAKELGLLPVFVCRAKDGSVHCVVCLGAMENGELARLLPACRHVFHAECIDAWLGVSSSCPVCRTEVRTAAPASGMSPES